MKKFGSYKILNRERLIVEYHAGDINVDDFIDSRRIISADSDYDPDFDLIFDYRDVNMLVKVEDVRRFMEFFKTFPQISGKRKSAYVTSRPNEVVITTLFSREITGTMIQSRTFSTIKGAVDWINHKELDVATLNKIIKGLKSQPGDFYK